MLKENMTDDACRMSWINISIGDLGRVVTGDTPPKKNPEFYGGRYPFIKPTDMKVGERHTHLCEDYYSDEAFEKYKKKLIPPGATAVVTIGSIGQKITFIDRECFVNQAVNAVIPDVDKYDPLFVFYLLKNNLNLVKCADTGASSGRENVSKSNFSSLSVCVPECIEEQRKIGFLLGTYDDLIEVNSQHIQLLEESARLLYREWFIKLRFPNHEQTKIVDGIPEGWSKQPFDALAEIVMGQSPKSEFYNEDGKGLPFHQGVTQFGERFVTDTMFTTEYSRESEAGDILCSVRAPVGRLNITCNKIAIGRGLSAMRSRFGWQSLLFYQLKDYFVQEDMIGSGAIFASVSKKELFSQELLQPTDEVADSFDRFAKQFDEQIEALTRQNVRLRQARDALLPKLMSGELRC